MADDNQTKHDISHAEQQLDRLKERLSEYDMRLGLLFDKVPEESLKWLSLSSQEIRDLDEQTLSIACYELGRYCLFLQNQLNTHRTHHYWASAVLSKRRAQTILNYENYRVSWEDKRIISSLEDPISSSYYDLMTKSQMMILRLDGIIDRIQHIIKTMSEISYSKRRLQ